MLFCGGFAQVNQNCAHLVVLDTIQLQLLGAQIFAMFDGFQHREGLYFFRFIPYLSCLRISDLAKPLCALALGWIFPTTLKKRFLSTL